MKAGILLSSFVAAALLIGVLSLGLRLDDETARWVPLQSLPTEAEESIPEDCHAHELNRAVTEALVASEVPIGRIDALEDLPDHRLRPLLRKVLDCKPWSLAPDQSRLSAAVVDAWLRSRHFSAFSPTAHRACRAFRWQSFAIEDVAESCDQVLSGLPGRWAARKTSRVHGLRLRADDDGLLKANRRFLQRPYDPQRVVDLALQLEMAGYPDAAKHLHREVIQMSPDAASALENALEMHRRE